MIRNQWWHIKRGWFRFVYGLFFRQGFVVIATYNDEASIGNYFRTKEGADTYVEDMSLLYHVSAPNEDIYFTVAEGRIPRYLIGN